MKNLNEAKKHLLLALRHMPDDFALSDSRAAMKMALTRLEHVEKKREKRQEIQNTPIHPVAPQDLNRTFKVIDDMIEQEKSRSQKRLDELRKSHSDSGPEENPETDLFG